jgi:hypothetical protein
MKSVSALRDAKQTTTTPMRPEVICQEGRRRTLLVAMIRPIHQPSESHLFA